MRRITPAVMKLLAALVFISTATVSGCDETDCEERCVGDDEVWLDDCEECGDGVLFERECAEIWCE